MSLYFKTFYEVFSKKRNVYLFLGLYAFRYLLATVIPLGSDEAYYWDWGRDLQLSYYDHPPFVAWISWFGQQLIPGKSFLEGRLLVPLMHFLSSLNLIFISRILNEEKLDDFRINLLILATQLAPIMNLGGFMLMPDASLIFCLSSYFALCAYYLIQNGKYVPLFSPISIGLFAGLAFTSKYHGIAMVGSSALYLFFASRKFRSILFIMGFLLSFFIAASPVLIWNYHHNFISLSFQMRHGFAQPSFHFIWGARIIFAQLLLCTPLVIFKLTKIISRYYKNPVIGFLAAGSIPLLILFLITGFFKEVLPHWPLPCLIMLSPALVLAKPATNSSWLKFNFIYSFFLVGIITTCLGFGGIRHQLPKILGNKPGALGEITLWDRLIPELNKHGIWNGQDSKESSSCQTVPVIGSFRWFWVAQIALNSPNPTKVVSFDQNHLSYYNFRDKELDLTGCQVILIGEAAHIDLERLKDSVSISREENLLLTDHQDRPIKLIWGQVLKKSILLRNRALSLSKN